LGGRARVSVYGGRGKKKGKKEVVRRERSCKSCSPHRGGGHSTKEIGYAWTPESRDPTNTNGWETQQKNTRASVRATKKKKITVAQAN